MRVAVRSPLGISSGQRTDRLIPRYTVRQISIGDEANSDDTASQQNTLHGINVCDRTQTTGSDINQNNRRKQPHTGVNAEHAVSQYVEQETGSTELQAEIRNRENHGHDNDQNRYRVLGSKIIPKHLTGRDKAEALANHPLTFQKHNPGERNGNGVEGRVGVLETVTIDQAGMAHERPTGKRRCRRGKHEDPQ